jgi:DNA-binding NtrC family response regulator
MPKKMKKTKKDSITVLLVDDSATARSQLFNFLKEMGHQPLVAEDGAKALKILKNITPELVICDLVMPGMDGLELLEHCRGLYPDIPFLIITAHASLETAVEALRAGAQDYITRPVNIDILSLRIQNAISRRRLHQEFTQRQKLETALATVGGVSHELNQPLMAIMASAELIANMENLNRVKELAKVIEEQAKRIADLTKQLTNLERFETMSYAGELKVMDIKASSKD